ncbi:MAG: tRNA 5-methoxyuridine(34)/uridine 5-oxyacetic acid(34) synthase CmoB [Gammaproteobacteria bacterium]|nr:MAG: tRNA 5-methoxyuridine(34)/uridine 5-oxyacetic acid(34) synthase CmoB [Gammaproteobacteria bacterium]
MMLEEELFVAFQNADLHEWLKVLPEQLERGFSVERFGDLPKWEKALQMLPSISAYRIDLNADAITVSGQQELSADQQQQLHQTLKQLMPWRKGPYDLHGVYIDTEWRSDWKWNRVREHIAPLTNRTILDVGCGNGYHGWRMIGEGARLVIGIDPSPLFVMQYRAVRHFAGHYPLYVLPLGIEAVPEKMRAFDSVFSMGVFYHRRSPIDHLLQLRDCLKSGGELVLETLVIEGDAQRVLVPEDRYGKMRNVWFIPSCDAVMLWMRRCGFREIRLVDVTPTIVDEQRRTEWMQYESLADYLDPEDCLKTVEGYPAPRRAIFIATAP